MTEQQQQAHPAILLSRFDGSAEQIAMASQLQRQGYPVIASCEPGSPAVDEARNIDCAIVETGGGEGLRRGLEYFNVEMREAPGIVTLDAGHGYPAEDVLIVAEALCANPGKFVAASRATAPGSGIWYRLERWLAATAFAFVHGRKVRDPWSGLRAVPAGLVGGFLGLKGEGRSYAFNMVLNLQHLGVKAVSVPVCAVDEPADGPGFWDRAADIFRILLLPLKFVSASLTATLGDYAISLFFEYVLNIRWEITQTVGRTTGAVIGYLLNRNLVFRRKNSDWKRELISVLQFALLAICNYGISMLAIEWMINSLRFDYILAKMLADIVLFTTSYLVQREVIFRRKQPSGK